MKHEKLINLFERVQRIPYRICKFEPDKINEGIPYGSCRHKSELLYQLATQEGYSANRLIVIFDWRDLPIPANILEILKKSGTRMKHSSLEIRVGEKWLKVDSTWNLELEAKGFPSTKNWDGLTDTKQVTEGKLEFHDVRDDIRLYIYEEERARFASALNEWLGS